VIVYLDSSALVKVFIENEVDRAIALDGLAAASSAVTSAIAYAECRAAFARRYRSGDIGSDQLGWLVAQFDEMWPRIGIRPVSEGLARFAGYLAQDLALRGYDAVHLATALVFAREIDSLEFLGFDDRLNEAARLVSLRVFRDGTNAAPVGDDT
jgi:predicted nucleic acid-binding protein